MSVLTSSPIEVTQSQLFNGNVLISFRNSINLPFNSVNKRLVLLIDISGSMRGERINLVLHAIKVIISASNENIEISIFTFDSNVSKIESFNPMNETNKKRYLDLIPNIPLTFGSTALLQGLEQSLKYIKVI